MIKNRQYQFLLKPTPRQRELIIRTFGAVRFVHNQYIDDYKAKKIRSKYAKDIIREYKNSYGFLKEIDSSALMNAIFQLQDRIEKVKRYKKRSDSYMSFTVSNLEKRPIYISYDRKLYLESFGFIDIVYHRQIPRNGSIRKVTVVRKSNGSYHASITVSEPVDSMKTTPDPLNSIGLDYSSPYLFVDSEGNRANMPHFYQQSSRKIAELDRKMSSSVHGSNNYYRYKLKRAETFERIANQRKDYLHKLSKTLADKYDVICVEKIDMQEIAKGLNFGRRTYDNSYATFVGMLKYKLEDRGKLLLYADKYYPSSRLCSNCGELYKDLKLEDRIWACPKCGKTHDRDVNAATNIRNKCVNDHFGRRVFG